MFNQKEWEKELQATVAKTVGGYTPEQLKELAESLAKEPATEGRQTILRLRRK